MCIKLYLSFFFQWRALRQIFYHILWKFLNIIKIHLIICSISCIFYLLYLYQYITYVFLQEVEAILRAFKSSWTHKLIWWKSNGSLKNLIKTVFANSFSFFSYLFFQEGREKGKRITSFCIFSDSIVFTH